MRSSLACSRMRKACIHAAILVSSGGHAVAAAPASTTERAPEILVLVPYSVAIPYSRSFVTSLTEHVTEQFADARIHVEALPLDLQLAATQNSIKKRLSRWPPDMVVGMKPEVAALRAAGVLPPEIPITLLDFAANSGEGNPRQPAGTVSLLIPETSTACLHLAIKLFPERRSIAVIGTRPTEYFFRPDLPAALAAVAASGTHRIIDLTGQTIAELKRSVASLPPDTVVMLFGPQQDRTGKWIFPPFLMKSVAALHDFPVVSDVEPLFGMGSVGGLLIDPVLLGEATARMVIRRLNGEAVAQRERVGFVTRVDWRQLRRFGGREDALPIDAVVEFRPPGLWESHRGLVIATMATLTVLVGLVASLVLERRRRRLMEEKARERLAELAHLNRVGLVSQLSFSLAHDLNQPLGTILCHAQTCEVLLDQPSPPREALRSALSGIVSANGLASGIVGRLRSLAARRAPAQGSTPIDTWVEETMALLAPDVRQRQVTVSLDLRAPAAKVALGSAQFQQILINLVSNAMEAMAGVPARSRRLGVSTTLAQDGASVHLRVEDTGTGLPDDPAAVFAPFFSTKDGGLGLGLCIVRELAESIDGTLTVHHNAGGGARFELCMPVLRPQEETP